MLYFRIILPCRYFRILPCPSASNDGFLCICLKANRYLFCLLFIVLGVTESKTFSLCEQARRQGMYERGRDIATAKFNFYKRPCVAYTNVLRFNWKWVSCNEWIILLKHFLHAKAMLCFLGNMNIFL